MYRNYLNHAIFEVCYIYGMSTPTVDTTAAAKDAWALFWRIFSADKPRRMATLSELGLAPMQSMALMQLRPGEPMTMSAMAHALQCDNSNVTGIADRLEAMGLIERRAAEHDRRVKTLVITELGKQVRDQVERRMSVPPPPLAGLSEEDAIALRDILQRALATSESGRSPGPTYFADGRISRASRFCSRMCADQPAVRAQVNSA